MILQQCISAGQSGSTRPRGRVGVREQTRVFISVVSVYIVLSVNKYAAILTLCSCFFGVPPCLPGWGGGALN